MNRLQKYLATLFAAVILLQGGNVCCGPFGTSMGQDQAMFIKRPFTTEVPMPDSRFSGYMPGFINNELALVEGLRTPFEARKKPLEKCKDFPGELKRTYWNPTAEDDDSEEAGGVGGEKILETASWPLQNNHDQVAMIILQLQEGKRGTDYVLSAIMLMKTCLVSNDPIRVPLRK